MKRLAHQRGNQRRSDPRDADGRPTHLAERLVEGDDIGRRHVEGSGYVTACHQQQGSDDEAAHVPPQFQ